MVISYDVKEKFFAPLNNLCGRSVCSCRMGQDLRLVRSKYAERFRHSDSFAGTDGTTEETLALDALPPSQWARRSCCH